MIRIGIIGTESSHTNGILRYLNTMDNVAVTAIWGEDDESCQKVMEQFQLDCRMATPQDMIGKVDGVMVTTRDGKNHLEQVRPLIGKNIAIWIDKPFTASVADAKELIGLLEENGVPYSGGTAFKQLPELFALKSRLRPIRDNLMSGYFSYWLQLDSPYSGMHFYSHHLIEAMLLVYGYDAKTVIAKRTANSLAVIVSYDTFNVILNYGTGVAPSAAIYGERSSYRVDLCSDTGGNEQIDEFIEVIQTGRSPYPAEHFLTTVKVSNAIEQAMTTGREIMLAEVE